MDYSLRWFLTIFAIGLVFYYLNQVLNNLQKGV